MDNWWKYWSGAGVQMRSSGISYQLQKQNGVQSRSRWVFMVKLTQLSHLRKAAAESLSWLLNCPQTAFYDGSQLGCIWMHLSQDPWRPSPWSTAQNAHRMWVKPSRQKTQTLMSSITEACAKNWLNFPDRFTRRCMVLSRYSRAPFQN